MFSKHLYGDFDFMLHLFDIGHYKLFSLKLLLKKIPLDLKS